MYHLTPFLSPSDSFPFNEYHLKGGIVGGGSGKGKEEKEGEEGLEEKQLQHMWARVTKVLLLLLTSKHSTSSSSGRRGRHVKVDGENRMNVALQLLLL
jgi:hypothetical protein